MANNDGVGPGGKGDKPRPTDKKKFDEGWERIFGKKDKEDNLAKMFAINTSSTREEGIALYEAAKVASEEYLKKIK